MTMPRRGWSWIWPALLAGAMLAPGLSPRLAAQDAFRSLFPRQAPIYVTGSNLSRLELPVEVVAALGFNQADLAILDSQGARTPFVVDVATRFGGPVQAVTRLPLTIADVDRGRSDRRDGPPIFRESYILGGADGAEAEGFWDLVVETGRGEFVRRVRVTALSGDGAVVLIDDGSLFRLANPQRERNRLTLPRFTGARLQVEIEGEDGVYLEPTFRLEHSASVAAPEQDRLPLIIASREEQGRQTIVELERPRGVRAVLLAVETSTPTFSRRLQVWDSGPGAVAPMLGGKDLYRVRAAESFQDLETPLGPATGNRLRVVIENGDSPPLADLAFAAVSPRMSLVFTLPSQGNDTPSGTLLFGGGRVPEASYDVERLQSLLHPPQQGRSAYLATQLYAAAPARLGPIADNTAYEPAPALSYAMRPGGTVDPRLYTHRRKVVLNPSAEGLSLLVLGVEDLAKAQPDLRDVRIVDAESRQWAYISARGEPLAIRALRVEGPVTENGVSEYALAPPAAPASFDQIRLEIGAPFFDRQIRIVGLSGDVESTLYAGRLRRGAGETQPLQIALDARRVDSLKLRIQDGDDAPLALDKVEARFLSMRLFVAAPAGQYTLLLGNEEDQAPSYELEQVRAAVSSVPGHDAQLGALEDNPDFSARARLATGSGPQQLLLWAALILVVGGLSFITLRTVRQQAP